MYRTESLITLFWIILLVGTLCLSEFSTGASVTKTSIDKRIFDASSQGSSGKPEDNQDIRIKSLQAIYLPVHSNAAEERAALVLQQKLSALYGVKLKIVREHRWRGEPAILVGPELAVLSGVVIKQELTDVKYDGYIIRGSNNLIVLSGHSPPGTLYAAYAFLRQVGLKIYPWHYSNGLEVLEPVKNGILRPFSISERPFFEFRDFLYRFDKGAFGGTQRPYVIGDLEFARNSKDIKYTGYVGWPHTADFLVPVDLYYDKHPEYYGKVYGRRIPKSTRSLKVPLCTCEPDVISVSAKRALEWVYLQKDKRYFTITDGDVVAECSQCEATDPLPDYNTDRNLQWVNAVARAVGDKYADKVLLTLAYLQSVKPPVETQLEPNVLVMYAPWYWTSRNTSEVSFAHPLNVVAMEELLGWVMRFPGQVGLFDYPGPTVNGTPERFKFFAKNHITWLHANAPADNLLHWVASQLLWDPFQDSSDLEQEFLRAFYGPAASVMAEYLALQGKTIKARSLQTRYFFRDRGFQRQARKILAKAEAIAKQSDLHTQTRILEGVLEGLYTVIKHSMPIERDRNILREDFRRFIRIQQQILQNCKKMRFDDSIIRGRINQFKRKLSGLKIVISKRIATGVDEHSQRELFGSAVAQFDDMARRTKHLVEIFPFVPRNICASVSFTAKEEQKNWSTYSSEGELASSATAITITNHTGIPFAGINFSAALSKLPTLKRGGKTVHAGRFYAERVFDPPLQIGKCIYLDFHFFATKDVPVTIYIDKLQSDVLLHPGEQFVRVDLSNFAGHRGGIQNIGLDIWPQDNFFPYPDIQDTDVTILDLQVRNYSPEPTEKALWLTHFRSNVPFGKAITDLSDKDKLRRRLIGRSSDKMDRSIGYTYGRRYIGARFRSFTAHKVLSPITTILTQESASTSEHHAALVMQEHLETMYGVKLPINTTGIRTGPHTGNAIIIGKELGLQSGLINQRELNYAGEEGFVIRARNGRIVIAGGENNGTLFGAIRYLEDHGAKFGARGSSKWLPDKKNTFLHELYLVDWPYFGNRSIRCGTMLKTQLPAKFPDKLWLPNNDAISHTKLLAASIKDRARHGDKDIGSILEGATHSPLSCYVAAKLLWNPFDDTNKLINEYLETPSAAANNDFAI